MEADRVLRPLTEAGAAIAKLDTYESPAVLTEALRATWHGVDGTLRTMLREDVRVPDALRLTALSQELVAFNVVVQELSSRSMISIELAGRVHELEHAVRRIADGDVRAADADLARRVAGQVRAEVMAFAALDTPPPAAAAARIESRPTTAVEGGQERTSKFPRSSLVLGSIAGIILIGSILALHFHGRSSSLEDGIAAFRNDSMGVAERHFRSVLNRDRTSVTAQLYLARVLRGQGRRQEAADLLREAAEVAPADAAVRRELGYLFLDMRRPESAVAQFELAVEHDPADALNWVGLVEALVGANDPRATEVLARAPADAQAMVRTRRR